MHPIRNLRNRALTFAQINHPILTSKIICLILNAAAKRKRKRLSRAAQVAATVGEGGASKSTRTSGIDVANRAAGVPGSC